MSFKVWLSRNRPLAITISSGSLIILAWLAGFLSPGMGNLLMIAAALVAGYPIAKTALLALKARLVGIQLLVTIAALGGIALGNYWEAAAVTFLFALGHWLESRALGKTREAIRALLDLAPATANVIREGKEEQVAAEDVRPGETVVIRSGGKIPVDGEILRGSASVNQAAITGESVPVELTPGAKVFSGALVEAGFLEVAALRVGEDTTFSRILHMVEEAQDRKAPTQLFLERFARWYTPGIIVLAILAGIITGNITLALTLLVIGCPGALVISTPVSMVAGIGNAAQQGVLVKGGEFLELAGKVTLVALDKTGTLTQGRPQVTAIQAEGDYSQQEILNLAAAVEQGSEHHLGRAILQSAGDSIPTVTDLRVFPGGGIQGLVGADTVLVGNRRLLEENHLKTPASLENWLQAKEEQAESPVLVAKNGIVIGAIAIADTLRPEAVEAVAKLKKAGKKVWMLTGDNPRTAQAIASRLNLDGFMAGLLPEDKVAALRTFKAEGHIVAMVGDGINDTPALAAADLSIAMGAAGTDAAIEIADMALMSDNLDKLPRAFVLGRATLANIRQNVSFAVVVVFLLVIGVLGQRVFLATGMLAHEASVMLVILNALRLRKIAREPGDQAIPATQLKGDRKLNQAG